MKKIRNFNNTKKIINYTEDLSCTFLITFQLKISGKSTKLDKKKFKKDLPGTDFNEFMLNHLLQWFKFEPLIKS